MCLEQIIKNGPSKIYGIQNLNESKPYHSKFFKGCILQILLGPFLNILSHYMAQKCYMWYFDFLIFNLKVQELF